ncbi:MAG TPA: HDOD domain-containing protein [bacterium]|nr:HDOD domain-containing protein [bacterium]
MINLNDILEKIDKLPNLSPTVAKVIEVANNLNSTPRELVTVIKMDPVLTGKVIKLINSSYFALSQEVTSLERAVIMLGLNTIKNLALSTAVIDQFNSKDFKLSNFNIDEFWKHSLAVAVGSKILSIAFNVEKKYREEFFIAGLLHDIGKLIIARYFPNEMNAILRRKQEENISILTIENQELQFSHPEIGEKIADKWKLSSGLKHSISSHHGIDFSEYKNPDFKLLLSVYISNYYCVVNNIGFAGDQNPPELNPLTWKAIKMTKEQCFELLAPVTEELNNAMIFLKTN